LPEDYVKPEGELVMIRAGNEIKLFDMERWKEETDALKLIKNERKRSAMCRLLMSSAVQINIARGYIELNPAVSCVLSSDEAEMISDDGVIVLRSIYHDFEE